jgi:hypothetical protein
MSLSVGDMFGPLNSETPLRTAPKGGRAKATAPVKTTYYDYLCKPKRLMNMSGNFLATSPDLPNLRADRQEIMLDGAIDPASSRNRHNPLTAPAYNFVNGAARYKYALPASTGEATNAVDLIRASRKNYYSRLHYLDPIPNPSQARLPPQIQPSLLKKT